MKKTSGIVLSVILVLLAAGGGFYGGMRYQKSKSPTLPSFAGRFNGQPGTGNGSTNGSRRFGEGNGGSVVRGTLSQVSGNTATVKLSDGSSKIVIIGSNATITKSDTATASDLTDGQTVMIIGTTNSDGSVTATDVQLNPQSRQGFPGEPAPSGTATQ
ncbi:MAG: hypothetical protein V1778_01955 [bacterium]